MSYQSVVCPQCSLEQRIYADEAPYCVECNKALEIYEEGQVMRTEKLQAELARLHAQEKDNTLKSVLAHFIEQVPDEVAFHEDMQSEHTSELDVEGDDNE